MLNMDQKVLKSINEPKNETHTLNIEEFRLPKVYFAITIIYIYIKILAVKMPFLFFFCNRK